jgi:hypothetical protein
MRLKTVQFVSLVLVMLVTGVFWGSWLGLSRSIQTFTPDTFLAIGHTMIGNLASVMPVLVVLAALSQRSPPMRSSSDTPSRASAAFRGVWRSRSTMAAASPVTS